MGIGFWLLMKIVRNLVLICSQNEMLTYLTLGLSTVFMFRVLSKVYENIVISFMGKTVTWHIIQSIWHMTFFLKNYHWIINTKRPNKTKMCNSIFYNVNLIQVYKTEYIFSSIIFKTEYQYPTMLLMYQVPVSQSFLM